MLKRPLVFFDVDDTLVNGQTQKILGKYLYKNGKVSIAFVIKILFYFLMWRIGIVKNVVPIRKEAYKIIGGWEVSEVEKLLRECFSKEIRARIFPQALDLIKKHQMKGHEVILISGSIDCLLRIIKEYIGIKFVIATVLKVENDRYTGEVMGPVIHGESKVSAILNFISEHDYSLEESYAYSDDVSDLPLLQLAQNPVAVNPNKKLRKIAQLEGWPISYFSMGE